MNIFDLSNGTRELHYHGDRERNLRSSKAPSRGKGIYKIGAQPRYLWQLIQTLFCNVGRYCNHFSKHFAKVELSIRNVRAANRSEIVCTLAPVS